MLGFIRRARDEEISRGLAQAVQEAILADRKKLAPFFRAIGFHDEETLERPDLEKLSSLLKTFFLELLLRPGEAINVALSAAKQHFAQELPASVLVEMLCLVEELAREKKVKKSFFPALRALAKEVMQAQEAKAREASALADSERAWWKEVLATGATEGMVIKEKDSGKILFANPAFAHLLGYAPEDLLGKTWMDITPPDDLEKEPERLPKLSAHQHPWHEKAFLRQDGVRVQVFFSQRIIAGGPFSAEEVCVCSITPLEKVKNLEGVRRQAEEAMHFWHEVFDAAGAGMLVVDGERCIEVNQCFETMVGASRTMILSSFQPSSFFDEMDAQIALEACKRLYDRETRTCYEARLCSLDGRIIPVRVWVTKTNRIGESGLPIIVATVEDISDIKAKEEDLQKKESYWRQIFESAGQGISIQEGGRYVDVNRAWAEGLGFSKEEILSPDFSLSSFLDEEEKEKVLACRAQVLAGESVLLDVWIRRGGKDRVLYRLAYQKLSQEEGEAPHLVIIATDLTEIKEKERLLEERERFWRQVFESAGEGIVVAKMGASGPEVVEANSAFARLLDYTAEEIKTPSFFSRVTPAEWVEREIDLIKNAALKGEPARYEKPHIRKNGAVVLTQATVYPMAGQQGWLVATFADLTLAKAKEEEIALVATLAQELLSDLAQGRLVMAKGSLSGAARQIQETFNEAVLGLDALLSLVRESARVTVHATQDLLRGQKDLVLRTTDSAAHLEQISANVEEISETVSLTTQNIQAVDALMDQVEERTRHTSAFMEEVAHQVTQVAKSAKETMDIAQAIRDVANKTDFLSLNASIEAAKAGREGSGFGVLAREIRALAERSGREADEARKRLEALVGVVQEVQSRMEEANSGVRSLSFSMTEARGKTEEIASSAREEDHALKEIARAVAEVSQHTEENADLSSRVQETARDLAQGAEAVSRALERFVLGEKNGQTRRLTIASRNESPFS